MIPRHSSIISWFMVIVCIRSIVGFFPWPIQAKVNSIYRSSSFEDIINVNILPDPVPGRPVIKKLDKTLNTALISIAVAGETTNVAFTKSCELFNEEVKKKGYKVPGFRLGTKLPAMYLYEIFGEDKVKLLCGNLMSNEIQEQCEKSGLKFVGRGRIVEFNEKKFQPGNDHIIDIECDLWPEIVYRSSDPSLPGYKGLQVRVNKGVVDNEKVQKVKESIMERYKSVTACEPGYESRLGDIVFANMKGFERSETTGLKGNPLPNIAMGDKVEIALEGKKFMDGLVEGLVGMKAGEVRDITVTFPLRAKGAGAALSGKQAIFEVEALEIRRVAVPQWDEDLAARVRTGMTLDELNSEVAKAVEGDGINSTENQRNEALAAELIKIIGMNQVPESLVEENTQAKFQNMLMDFKDQGSTDEEIQQMATPEKYNRYKEISRPNVEKMVKLGMAFRDIAERENISISAKEIQEQFDLIAAQSRQKGEAPPDESRTRDEIENVLLRRKVFNFIASFATIQWIDTSEGNNQVASNLQGTPNPEGTANPGSAAMPEVNSSQWSPAVVRKT